MDTPLIFLTDVDRQIADEEGIGLGPWVSSNDIVLSDTPLNKREAHQADQHLREMTEGILPKVAAVLNDIHSLDCSERYWSIVLYRSVHRLVSMSYERLVLIRYAVAQLKGDPRFSTLEADEFHPPISLRGILQFTSESNQLNWQLFSQCVRSEGLAHTDISNEFSNATHNFAIRFHEKRWIERLVSHENRGLQSRVAHHGLRISSRFAKLRLLIGTRGKAWEVRQFPIEFEGPRFSERVALEKRKRLASLDWKTDDPVLQELLGKCLRYNLPAVFIEEFSRLRNEVTTLIERNGVPDVILTGPMVGQTPFRMWTAECVHRGSKLFLVQHGSGYGDWAEDEREAQERRVADKFLTWGWKRRKKDFPLPVPRFAGTGPERKEKYNRNGVLWITPGYMSYAHHKYPLWLRTHQLGVHGGFETDHSHRVNCYQSLDEHIRSDTTIRYKGSDPEVETSVKRIFGNDHVGSNGTLLDQARTAHLSVIDHFPATSLYELIHVNIPVVVVDDIPDWYLDGAATDVLWDLVECGVIHRNAESAANLINDIYPNVEAWWDQPERQSTVSRARHRLARSADAPMAEYAAFINQHLE